MKFEERSYNSSIIRPKPLVFVDTSENFILMLSSNIKNEEKKNITKIKRKVSGKAGVLPEC